MNIKVRVAFRINSNRAFDLSKFQDLMQEFFHTWSDGRQPFEVEVLSKSMNRIFQDMAYAAIEQEVVSRVGNVMVSPTTGRVIKNIRRARTATRLSRLKTEREMRSFFSHVYGYPEVSVEECPDEE